MQEGKYINRYEVLFTLAKEYTGCDTQEILLSIKKRMHQITDFFRIADMKKDDLFGYKYLQPVRVTRRCFHFVQAIAFDSRQPSKGFIFFYFFLFAFSCLYACCSASENGFAYSFTLILSIAISCISCSRIYFSTVASFNPTVLT